MSDGRPPLSYTLRGLSLVGFADQAAFIDHLAAGGRWQPGMLVAINAEKMLTRESDAQVAELIDDARFCYPDGISVVRAIRKKYPQARLSRIAGADLWEGIMARAGHQGSKVFLLGGKPDVLQQTADKLQQQWQVNIVDMQDGYFTAEQRPALLARIAASGAEIVTVAMGSPKQELLMRDCQLVHPQALYMGVGGTYDVFTGRVKRAPLVWQNLGLEWLYRLLSQPSRLKRQLRLLRFVGWYLRGDF